MNLTFPNTCKHIQRIQFDWFSCFETCWIRLINRSYRALRCSHSNSESSLLTWTCNMVIKLFFKFSDFFRHKLYDNPRGYPVLRTRGDPRGGLWRISYPPVSGIRFNGIGLRQVLLYCVSPNFNSEARRSGLIRRIAVVDQRPAVGPVHPVEHQGAAARAVNPVGVVEEPVRAVQCTG